MSTKQPDRSRYKNDETTKENLNDVQNTYQIQLEKPFEAGVPGEISRKILGAHNVTLIGGPFHFHIRSGTYGDPYDEIPWKVRMGMALPKERHGYTDNPYVCQYEPRVLINNWVEETRDRNFIKYRAPRLSQYGHHYITETMRAYAKPHCNKQRDILLNISTFPITGHPGHQPELNVDTVRCSAPKPESCVEDEQIEKCKRRMRFDKRFYKASL